MAERADASSQTEYADAVIATLAVRIRDDDFVRRGRFVVPAPELAGHGLWPEVVDAIARRLMRGGIDLLDLSGVPWTPEALEKFAQGVEAGGGADELRLNRIGLGGGGPSARRRMIAAGRLARAARSRVALRSNGLRKSDIFMLFESLQGLQAREVHLDDNRFTQDELRGALEEARRRQALVRRAMFVPDGPGRPGF